jgi:hypothetical protein
MPPTVLVAVVTIPWVVPGSWVRVEVTGAVMLLTVPPTEVTVPVPVLRTWPRAEVTGAVTAETVPVAEDVTALPVEDTCVTACETGPVTLATAPVRDDVRALPVDVTWLAVEETTPVADGTELASAELPVAEVAGWLAEAACPAADWTVPAVPDVTLPAVCVAAEVAADVAVEAVEVAPEDTGALVDAVVLAAGAADADAEPVTVEMVDWPVEAVWPTAEDRSAVTEVVLVAAPSPVLFWAVVAPGLVAAEADLAVRRDSPIATPMAARAMPAAHRQNRRTLVTSPLVTTVTLIRSGRAV